MQESKLDSNVKKDHCSAFLATASATEGRKIIMAHNRTECTCILEIRGEIHTSSRGWSFAVSRNRDGSCRDMWMTLLFILEG